MLKHYLKTAVVALVAAPVSASWLSGNDQLPSADELNDILGNFERRMAETQAEEMRVLESTIRGEYEDKLQELFEAAVEEEQGERHLAGGKKMLKWKVKELSNAVRVLQKDVKRLQKEKKRLERKTACIAHDSGKSNLYFKGCNVHVLNGKGKTSDTNGKGNLIVGYGECSANGCDRSGSHNIMTGEENEYSSYGGVVFGERNGVFDKFASVLGGKQNTALTKNSAVLGGSKNTASGGSSTVSGGRTNTVTATHASISGGKRNVASASSASVSGGVKNEADGSSSSILGGKKETTSNSKETIPVI